ncbi:MAG: acyl carrier protein [Lachnospiraceae bacterium]|nr:acyl carrier protein [Lachnospiraceae bacterium]
MFDRVKDILAGHISDSDVEITMDSALIDDLCLSSLEMITIISEFEDEFDIEVPDRIIPSIRTVGDIVKYLEENEE